MIHCFGALVRFVLGVWRPSWARPLPPRQAASDGMSLVALEGRAEEPREECGVARYMCARPYGASCPGHPEHCVRPSRLHYIRVRGRVYGRAMSILVAGHDIAF